MKLFKKLLHPEKRDRQGDSGDASCELPACDIGCDAVNYRETAHHGPLASAVCMAVDPVQGLVAVGGSDGSIKVWGRRGVERKLKAHASRDSAVSIAFVPGRGYLVAGTASPSLQLWDLRRPGCTSDKCQVIPLASVPNCLHIAADMLYCWVGCSDGTIRVASLAKKTLSTYEVTPRAMGQQAPAEVISCTQLQHDGGQLVIGLASGAIILWDVRGGKMIKQFLGGGRAGLHVVVPSPGGKLIAAGYVSGEVIIWMADKEKTPAFNIKAEDKGALRPVRDLDWTLTVDTQGKKPIEILTLIVLGGTPADQPTSILVLSGAQFVFRKTFELDSDAHYMQVLRTSPWQAAEQHLSTALTMRAGGLLELIVIGGQETKTAPLEGPSAMHPITCMAHVSSVPVQLAYRMGEFARTESISVPGEATRMPWELEEDVLIHPLFGGLPPMPPLTSPAPCFLATAHEDSVVHLWDVRTASLIPLDVHVSTLVISENKSLALNSQHAESPDDMSLVLCLWPEGISGAGGRVDGDGSLALLLTKGPSIELLLASFQDEQLSLKTTCENGMAVTFAVRSGGEEATMRNGAGPEARGHVPPKRTLPPRQKERELSEDSEGDRNVEEDYETVEKVFSEQDDNDREEDSADAEDGEEEEQGSDRSGCCIKRGAGAEGCVEFAAGFQPWVHADVVGNVTCSLVVAWAGRLIVGDSSGSMTFVDLEGRGLILSLPLKDPAAGESSPVPRALCAGPVLLSGKVTTAIFVALNSGTIVAHDVMTGGPLPMHAIGDASPDKGTPLLIMLLDAAGVPCDAVREGTVAASYLVCVCSSRIDVHILPLCVNKTKRPVASHTMNSDHISRAWSVHLHGEPAIVCLSATGKASVIGLPSLTFIASFDVAAAHDAKLEGVNTKSLCILPDGRTLVAIKGACDTSANAKCSLARGSIFAFENALQLPDVGGEVYRPDLSLPQPPKERKAEGGSLFGGLAKLLDGGATSGAWEDVFPVKREHSSTAQDHDMTPGAASAARQAGGRESASEEDLRRALMGGKKLDSRGSVREKGKAGPHMSEVSGAAGAAMQAKQALMERGEKLSMLQEKAGRLQDAAQGFEGMIREHNQKMAKKKWYHL